jgi:4-amino-4-deoxy-L-arabinose transferase-like glycosyltransferase
MTSQGSGCFLSLTQYFPTTNHFCLKLVWRQSGAILDSDRAAFVTTQILRYSGPDAIMSRQSFLITLSRWLPLILILLLAGWLRLGWPGIVSFGFDEARVSDMALQMAREGNWAALGMQSSTGVPNFPAAVWFFALPYRLSLNPLVATGLVGLLNVTAVLGIWWLGRTAWGREAGLVAALLLATSPYLIFYSRSIWSQNLLVPGAVLWAVAIVAGLQKGSGRWLALHAFLAGFIGQIHFAGFALALASLWLGFRFRLWRWWLAITVGLLGVALLALPTIFLIWRSGDGAKAVIADLLAEGTATEADRLAAWQQLGHLGLGRGWEGLWLNFNWTWPEPLASGLSAVGLMATGLLVIGTLWTGWQIARSFRTGAARAEGSQHPTGTIVLSGFVLVWAVAAPLLFSLPRTPVYIQYQLASLPALFLLMGATAAAWWPGWWRRLVVVTAVFIAVVQVTAVSQTLTLIADEFVPGGMGTPLYYPQTAVEQLTADDRPIVVETFGDIPEFFGDAAMFKVLLWDHPTQLVDARHVLLIPDEPSHLLFTYGNLPAWEVVTAVGPQAIVRELPRRQGEMPYVALTIDEVALRGFKVLERPWQLANGVALHGWQVQELSATEQIRLITHWRVSQPPEEGHFQQFNHLYLVGGDEPAAIQDIYTSSRAWQKGDHLITWVEFARPDAAIAHFHVGMYTWPDLQRSPILNRSDADPLYPIELQP